MGRADPWGVTGVDTVARAAASAGWAWAVLRILPGDGALSARIGRAMIALGAGLAVAALDGFPALLAWVVLLFLVVAVGSQLAQRTVVVGVGLAAAAAAAGGVALLQTADSMEIVLQTTVGIEDDLLVEPQSAQSRLVAAAVDIREAETSLNRWWARPARLLPVLAPHFRLADTVLDSSEELVTAALPLAGTHIDELVGAGRLDLVRLDQLSSDATLVAELAVDAVADLADLDATWLVGPARDELADAVVEMGDHADRLDRIARLSRGVLPHLGPDGPVSWFVMVCTPAEARATCGFPGNWVEFEVVQGVAIVVDSGRMAALEDEAEAAGLTLSGPPGFVAEYGRFDPVPTLRNITMTPDFPSSAEALATALEELGRGRPHVVAAVNTDGLEAILRITGPVDAGAMGQLNVQSVRPRLDVEQYSRFETQSERRAALEEATRAVMDRITTLGSLDPSKVRRLSEPADRGGLLAYVPGDPDNVFVDMGVAGELPEEPIAGVTAQNASANKLDAFRSVAMTLTPSTEETAGCATVDITLGTAPPDASSYVTKNAVGLPDGWLRSWVSIYTPTPVESATLDGEPLALERRGEDGHPVVSFFLDTGPATTSRIELVLTPGRTTPPTTLVQPSVQPYTVRLTDACP